MWQPRTGPFHTEPPLFKAAKHQVTSGQPQMGFLFPCSDCKPLTRLTSKDTQHRSTEVRPDRTRATPFPSQATALHIHTLTFAFCKKMIFFFFKLEKEEGGGCRVLGEESSCRWVLEQHLHYRDLPHTWFLSFSWPTQRQDFQSLHFQWQMRELAHQTFSGSA